MITRQAQMHNEAEADSLDCDLYRLISRAERCADTRIYWRKEWLKVARDLSAARPILRSMMSKADREKTA